MRGTFSEIKIMFEKLDAHNRMPYHHTHYTYTIHSLAGVTGSRTTSRRYLVGDCAESSGGSGPCGDNSGYRSGVPEVSAK